MDANDLITLAVSLAALLVSGFTALRQIRLASGGNHLPVVLEAFKESRKPEWFDAQEYILNRLAEEHAPDGGWRGLPAASRARVNTVGLFYDDLGKLVAHGVIDERLVIGSYGAMIPSLWDALAPYVYAERQAHGLHFWIYFEDLAARTAATQPEVVYAKLRLRSRAPHHRFETDRVSAGGATSNALSTHSSSGADSLHPETGPTTK